MKFSILSLFPEYFDGPFNVSMINRAREKRLIQIELINIRDFADDKHKTVDDRPYGGGPGMVLKAPPVVSAIRHVKKENSYVVYLSPQGKRLTAKRCRELSCIKHLILLCGHYEGIDERAIELEVDEELSIGDYVLTSGAPAAIVLVDAVSRFVPEVIGHPEANRKDSYEEGVFDHPHYTRPYVYEELKVPEVLLCGHHEKIDDWRREKAKDKTSKVRPELLDKKS